MSESGKQSEEEDEESSGLSGSSEEEDDWDPSYDYTGEESGPEEDEEAEFSEDEEDARRVVGRLGGDGEDWQYCEQGAVPPRLEPPQVQWLSFKAFGNVELTMVWFGLVHIRAVHKKQILEF